MWGCDESVQDSRTGWVAGARGENGALRDLEGQQEGLHMPKLCTEAGDLNKTILDFFNYSLIKENTLYKFPKFSNFRQLMKSIRQVENEEQKIIILKWIWRIIKSHSCFERQQTAILNFIPSLLSLCTSIHFIILKSLEINILEIYKLQIDKGMPNSRYIDIAGQKDLIIEVYNKFIFCGASMPISLGPRLKCSFVQSQGCPLNYFIFLIRMIFFSFVLAPDGNRYARIRNQFVMYQQGIMKFMELQKFMIELNYHSSDFLYHKPPHQLCKLVFPIRPKCRGRNEITQDIGKIKSLQSIKQCLLTFSTIINIDTTRSKKTIPQTPPFNFYWEFLPAARIEHPIQSLQSIFMHFQFAQQMSSETPFSKRMRIMHLFNC